MIKSLTYYRTRILERGLLFGLRLGFSSSTKFSIATFQPRSAETARPCPNVGYETAFVFQGPLDPNFRSTHALYRRLFPESLIITSTWTGVEEQLEFLQGDHLSVTVFSDQPAQRGIMNVNMQIVSTAAGIEAALTIAPNLTRIVKLRTDYAPQRPEAAFPIISLIETKIGAGRIWGVDINTVANFPYSFSDIFQIGDSHAMARFWNLASLDPRTITPKEFLAETRNQTDMAAIIRLRPPEMLLTIAYLKRCGINVDASSIEQYHSCLSRYFGIIDADQIGLAFDKYSPFRNGRYVSLTGTAEKKFVTMPSWLTHALVDTEKESNIS